MSVDVGNPPRLVGHERTVTLDDSVLWSRARSGDSEAFGMLFECHGRTIYNYCFRRVGNWAVAEDLVSIVFLEAWRRIDKPLPSGKELPWLFGIASNVVRNRRRSERRYAAALRRVPQPGSEPGFADISDERIDDEELMGRALALLARLPRREQEVFALCAWSGLSYEDAAIALGIPVGTVRSRLSRARARLQELDPGIGHEGDRMQAIREAVER
jgi:RNA polymerase sigma-70 factor (ECF subfamily)